MNNGSAVSAELLLALVAPQEETNKWLVASFYYDKDDPYAVRIAFHAGLNEPVEWVFARELLSSGIEGPQGLGDVKVRPSAGTEAGVPATALTVELFSPFGHAAFEAPLPEIADFLRRTYDVVPAGRESSHIDVDARLTEFLREVP